MQTSDLSARAEVSNRLASAANAWLKLCTLHVWDDDFISRGIKCTLYKVIVQSTLLYASELWAVPEEQLHRLEVLQMKCLRKICKVSLKDKIRNEVILGWCNVARVSNIVSHRRLRRLGHLARMPDERLPKRVHTRGCLAASPRGRHNHHAINLQPNCTMLGYHVQHHVQVILMPGCTCGPSLSTPILQSHSDATPCLRMTSRVTRGEDLLFLEQQHNCAI